MKKQKILDWIREHTHVYISLDPPNSLKYIDIEELMEFINEQQEYRGII
jgi:hypothetical protein